MAAVFPLDTTKPWTFNGVTYEYDAGEDRWYVISTNKQITLMKLEYLIVYKDLNIE